MGRFRVQPKNQKKKKSKIDPFTALLLNFSWGNTLFFFCAKYCNFRTGKLGNCILQGNLINSFFLKKRQKKIKERKMLALTYYKIVMFNILSSWKVHKSCHIFLLCRPCNSSYQNIVSIWVACSLSVLFVILIFFCYFFGP